ncbi:MAG: hypothetical protein DRN49_00320 [Thaumarchaeota archaeon]|nr:MAG: hypothetical protein DRN49_00320 [Nitrososphaerota archaeon]
MRDREFIESLDKGLYLVRGEAVAILTHAGGDPDSIGASYTLINILKKIYGVKKVLFTIPSRPSTHSRVLLNHLNLVINDLKGHEGYFIILDAGSPEQIEEYQWIFSDPERVMVIDHHTTSIDSYPRKVKLYVSDKYQSVCEMLHDLAELLSYELNILEAEALFAGIYYDTVRLSVADKNSLRVVCRLAEKGVNPVEFLSKLETKMELSERIARLKAASRMKIYKIGELIITLTKVGSYQSSCARSLLNLGAHIAVAAGESDEGVEISMRAVSEVIEKYEINLGKDVAERLGRDFGGHGGGHAAAARAYCREGDIDSILSKCLEILSEKLGFQAELMEA